MGGVTAATAAYRALMSALIYAAYRYWADGSGEYGGDGFAAVGGFFQAGIVLGIFAAVSWLADTRREACRDRPTSA